MRQRLEIGPTPCNEPCEQLGPNYDPDKARHECQTFRDQLRRTFGEPEGARLIIAHESHDFGRYYEVAVSFDEENEAATAYAFQVEDEAPLHWDDEARRMLHAQAEVL